MYTRDIHQPSTTVEMALYDLKQTLILARKQKDKVLCLIVGHGSKGGSHKIKTAVLEELEQMKNKNQIRGFIIGSDLDIFSVAYQQLNGKEEIPENCKRRKNPGEIFVLI